MTEHRPIFLVCQGRSGGTILAHALAESLPGTTLLNEPLHDELATHAARQAKRTPAHLRHDGVTDPWRGYVGVRFDTHATMRDAVPVKINWLDNLISQVEQRPVIKLLRMWGNLQRLRDAFPDADFIHLHREWKQQWASYNGLGFLRDYFGECRYGYKLDLASLTDKGFHRTVWNMALNEAAVLFTTVSLGNLTADPAGVGAVLARQFGWEAFDAERFASFFTRASK